MLYHFHVCTHDISRLRFIDFEESGVYVELNLCPSSLSLAEDFIMCMAEEFVHVFRLGPQTQGEEKWQQSEEQQHGDGESYVLESCTVLWLRQLAASTLPWKSRFDPV
jgi:hypothetical protein